jgi:pimeloyl-ACP methyl ester carboxylesterase
MTVATLTSGHSKFVTAPDGLRLHVRCYGAGALQALPVVCLPGLARTAADFETLASALANNRRRSRRVIAIDYRGRGQSEYDRDAANYTLQTELADVLAILIVLDCLPAIFIGTSRGGLLTMLLSALRPTIMAGAVLNDIGPVIEAKGLTRIKSYVGKLPVPRNFDEGAEILRRIFGGQFPKLKNEDWLAAARRTFKEEEGRLAPTYDVRLARTLNDININRPLPALWNQFDAMRNMPLMVIRGANSDILGVETVGTMRVRHPAMEYLEVPDQGHAPLLMEDGVIERIADFIDHVSH